MNIDLIYPASITGSSNYACEPPLGPIALYSSLTNELKQNVRFLDSTVTSQHLIEQVVLNQKPDIIAISCTSFNYASAIKLADIGKTYGAKIIIGGIHITHLRDNILEKMQSGERLFDYLISDYGEPAFLMLINAINKNLPLKNIQNLSYLDAGKILINEPFIENNRFDPLESPLDYSQIDFDLYSSKFKKIGVLDNVNKVGTLFTQRGCVYSGKNKCIFCSITKSNLHRTKANIKSDIISLIQRGVDHIRISDADFTINIRHLNSVIEAAEEAFIETNSKPTFYCFARADEIDIERIALLKKLNVIAVFIGYESGSDETLKYFNKNTNVEQNLKATYLLKENGIQVICGGIVLGAENESNRTLDNTLNFIKRLKESRNVESLIATPLMPLPGSIAFTNLLNVLRSKDYFKYHQLSNEDNFNINELIDLWCYYISGVPLYTLLDTCSKIEDIFKTSINFIDLEYSFKNKYQEV